MITYHNFFSPQQGQTVTDLAKEYGNKVIISLLENPQKAKEVSLFYQDLEAPWSMTVVLSELHV